MQGDLPVKKSDVRLPHFFRGYMDFGNVHVPISLPFQPLVCPSLQKTNFEFKTL